MLEHDFEGVERIPGAHCYEFYAGAAAFEALQEEEVGTFYLTDFLARNFERIVWGGLGLDQHPGLLETYFGNYRRLVYLAQTEDPELVERARAAADKLGLAFELRQTGLGDLATTIRALAAGDAAASGMFGVGVATGPERPRLSPQVPVPPAPGHSSRPEAAEELAVGAAMASATPVLPVAPARRGRSSRRPT